MKFFQQKELASLREAVQAEGAESQGEDVRDYRYGARGGWVRRQPKLAPIPQATAKTEQPAGPTAATLEAALVEARHIAGFVGACIVDSRSGLLLASEGEGALDLEAAAALNTQVVRAQSQAMESLGIDDQVEEILITLRKHLHLIRPLEAAPSIFLYVALHKTAANLGMVRMQVKKIESTLQA